MGIFLKSLMLFLFGECGGLGDEGIFIKFIL